MEKLHTWLSRFQHQKKKIAPWGAYFIGISFILLGCILFFRTRYENAHIVFLSPYGDTHRAPTPDPLYELTRQKRTIDQYPPSANFPINLEPDMGEVPGVSSLAYGVMDRDTKKLLFAKNLTTQHPIASLTKVMTVLLSLESAPLDLRSLVSSSAASIGEASMGLSSGELLTTRELMYGAMLPSGNDAAETLAESVGKYKRGIPQNDTDGGGARSWFLTNMNKKAQELSMYDTYFFNPTGLDEESIENTSFSTVLDLLALANVALENKTFAEIANTRAIHFPKEDGIHKDYYLTNILGLSDTYPGIVGIKPGNSIFGDERTKKTKRRAL